MAVGQNANVFLGYQTDKETKATDIFKVLPTNAGLQESIDTVESEAFTGNRFRGAADVVSIFIEGDLEVELTRDTLPYMALLSGFYEPNTPASHSTTLATSATSGTTEIEPETLDGIEVGDAIEIDDGTNTDSTTVDSYDRESGTVTLADSLANDYAEGDSVNLTDKYKHTLKVSNTLDTWGTGIVELEDESMYDEYIGIKGDSLTLSATQKAYVTASMTTMGVDKNNVDGSTVDTDYSGSITTPEDDRLISLDSFVEYNGSSITNIIDDFEINVNNNLDGDDYAINSKRRRDLIATQSDSDLSITTQFNKTDYNSQRQDLKEGTYISGKFGITNNVIVETPRVKLTEVSAPVDTADKITVSMNGNIYFDDSQNTPIILTVYDQNDTKYNA